MTVPSVTPSPCPLLAAAARRNRIARCAARGRPATGHPLFAANMAADRIALEAETRLPRKDVPIVVYDAGEGLVSAVTDHLKTLQYMDVRQLDGGLQAWQNAGYELFQGREFLRQGLWRTVESRRHTPSMPAEEVAGADGGQGQYSDSRCSALRRICDHEHPRLRQRAGRGTGVPRRQRRAGPETTIIVNCAGRTRSIIGTQSLINAGVANKVHGAAKRDDRLDYRKACLEYGADRKGGIGLVEGAKARCARSGLSRRRPASQSGRGGGVRGQTRRTLYRFDVRPGEEYSAGHIKGFRHYPGGQLVQEVDMAAPVRGARILLTDDRGVRADMTASWLAQMGWEAYVLDGGYDRRA